MQTLHLVTAALALSQLVLLALMAGCTARRTAAIDERKTALWLALFATAVCCYLALRFTCRTPDFILINTLLLLGANAVPASFWLLSRQLFRDEAALAPWVWAGLFGHWLIASLTELPALAVTALHSGAQWSKLLLLGLALAEAVSQWRIDLVESRRQLRVRLMMALGCYMGAVVLVEILMTVRGEGVDLLNLGGIWLFSLLSNLQLLEMRSELLHRPAPTASAAVPSPPPSAPLFDSLGVALQQALDQERIHARNGLTIGQLADHLHVPEYQLRRYINGQLGFRNFNDFLNQHRLDEVARRLVDPAQQRLPVLTLALDCGYSSLSPFNRAFKARFGLTPSEYRRQQLPHALIED
ncbi:MAG TPA: AraC family transcriptional regulator [Pseudomonadales bacterium]|jgi:AraC-like DNA-binding protein|nr:AraC family transcriptional regulator [Pseudomonadales bacterium]HMW16133.1 AraC family transcriptional regulator [Pseudomonadales bacterium]HNH72110.1 AraC family transcriptional regulator [Pseudomonadales bacterium]